MKSYRDFVSESYAARENLNEVFGLRTLGNLAWKGAKAVFGTNTGRKAVGSIGAYKAGEDMVKGDKSDKGKGNLYSVGTGAAAALMRNPYAASAALGLHMGDYLYRQLRRSEKQNREQGN
jgi:hypothetical protein